jgi:hypothetical protein
MFKDMNNSNEIKKSEKIKYDNLYESRIMHYIEVCNYLKQGNDLSFTFEDCFFKYNDKFRRYYRIKKFSTIQEEFRRREIIDLLGNYLRRVKLEKIKKKI